MSNLPEILSDHEEKNARTSRMNGIVAGTVTDNHDPEGLARVKVKLEGKGADMVSDWAHMASFMGGNGRGAVFLPEVGDQVLVAFADGHLDHPFVLGAIWSSSDTPPETNSNGNNDIRKIKSRSGHEITLDDSQGAEKIQISDKTGANIITFDSASGTLSLESQTTLKIKSQQIEIEAGASMKITASGTLEINGALVKIN